MPEQSKIVEHGSNCNWISECENLASRNPKESSKSCCNPRWVFKSCLVHLQKFFAYLYEKGLKLGPSNGPIVPPPFSGTPSTKKSRT